MDCCSISSSIAVLFFYSFLESLRLLVHDVHFFNLVLTSVLSDLCILFNIQSLPSKEECRKMKAAQTSIFMFEYQFKFHLKVY